MAAMRDQDNPDSPMQTEELWERFHEVVTMTSAELRSWLGTKPDVAPTPNGDHVPPLGAAVLAILTKRRTDLTQDDLDAMRRVIEIVEDETEGLEPDEIVADERRRHRLLSVGHDPARDGTERR